MSMSYGGSQITFPDGSTQNTAPNGSFKNRLINSDMRIDQRNAGASVTPTNGQYSLDRWQCQQTTASKYSVQQNAGSVTPPVGFSNYLGVTSLSAYSVLTSDTFAVSQCIEGFNVSDLGFGTVNAKTVTISAWVYSSLTGTFGGALANYANTRSYPFTYTISSANTWTQISVTIAGDTTGTWVGSSNAGAFQLWFGFGVGSTKSGTAGSWAGADYRSATGATSVVGTNGAKFYITGVQLEKGSTATSFDYRPYGTELNLCQRYYFKNKASAVNHILSLTGQAYATTNCILNVQFPVIMRTAPTSLEQSGTAADYKVLNAAASGVNLNAVPAFNNATAMQAVIDCQVASGLVAGNSSICLSTNSNAFFGWSAEL